MYLLLNSLVQRKQRKESPLSLNKTFVGKANIFLRMLIYSFSIKPYKYKLTNQVDNHALIQQSARTFFI